MDSQTMVRYSYGLVGYFMKYFAGLTSFAMALLFIYGLVVVSLAGQTTVSSINYIAGWSLLFFASLSLLWSTYFFIKHSSSFTKIYEFSNNGITVMFDGEKKWYPSNDIKEVIFRKWLKIFEIHFYSEPNNKLLLMDGGADFYKVKELFLNKPDTIIKWI